MKFDTGKLCEMLRHLNYHLYRAILITCRTTQVSVGILHVTHEILIEDKNVSNKSSRPEWNLHFIHVSELVFCNIYHVSEQVSDWQQPLMSWILACLAHHHFTTCHCTSLFFLSCFITVTTELTCHLHVHTASHVHTRLHYGCLWLTRLDSTQLLPRTALLNLRMTGLWCKWWFDGFLEGIRTRKEGIWGLLKLSEKGTCQPSVPLPPHSSVSPATIFNNYHGLLHTHVTSIIYFFFIIHAPSPRF